MNPEQCKVFQKAIYNEITRCGDELFILKRDGKYGIFLDRKITVPLKYNYLKYAGNDKFSISSDTNTFINSLGERLYT